jgi:hypothetical protein
VDQDASCSLSTGHHPRMPHFVQQGRDSRCCPAVATRGVQRLQKRLCEMEPNETSTRTAGHTDRPHRNHRGMLEHAEVPGVAGEGSPNSTNAASTGGPQSSGALAEMMAYSKCMRSHGILDFPDPTPNPGGPGGSFSQSGNGQNDDLDHSNPRYQTANKACQRLLPDGGQIPAPSAKLLAEEVRMAACMRSHSVPNFPDPDNADGTFDLGNVNRSSPQYQAAFTSCVSLTGFKGPMRVGISHQGP